MFFPRSSILGSLLAVGALGQIPARAVVPRAPQNGAPRLDVAGGRIDFAADELEKSWSFRGDANLAGDGSVRLIFGWRDAQNFAALQLQRAGARTSAQLFEVRGGKLKTLTAPLDLPATRGEIGLQRVGPQMRVLWNRRSLAATSLALPGARFGIAIEGAAKLESEDPQPTEPALLRDDFMRAEGPEATEIPGEWRATGSWRTSGTLGPRSDAALNPNPFVFRAQNAAQNGAKTAENVARAGKWWWNTYSVSASVRAVADENSDAQAPLRAAIEAFASSHDGASKGDGLRGEIDFARGLARLKSGEKVLASAPCDAESGQWHRLRLEPGPGLAKFWVDGVLAVQAPSDLAQGGVALRALAAPGALVDFDDVRVGNAAGNEWGEGALPERFQKDRLMSNWASNAKSWTRGEGGTWWHTGDFFGASQLAFPLPDWKTGQGAAILWGASGAAVPDAPAAYISREKDGYSLSIRGFVGAKTAPVTWKSAPGAIVTLKLTPQNAIFVTEGTRGTLPLAKGTALPTKSTALSPKSTALFSKSTALGDKNMASGATRARLEVFVAGKLVARREIPLPGGPKIGIRPMQDRGAGGQSWQMPAPQAITLKVSTVSRENRTAIGVNITPMTAEIARLGGFPDALGAIVDHVEVGAPAELAGVREGDVIRGVDGARVADVDSMRAAVGAVKSGEALRLEILRVPAEASGLDWAQCVASTPQVLDYSFTTAPIDWRAARGTWEVAERWTCSPQWSFFAGQNDAAPLLWSRFATQGDWTLEAYLATPMDLVRGERSPTDLNLVVGGDGREISSGYSFVFGGKNRGVNQVWRGDALSLEKPFEMPPGAGDVHQDWFYLRLERRQTANGVRFKYFVNGRVIADYLDKNPLPDGGHLGFWTQNGALSIARVRLWHSGLREAKRTAPPVASPATVSNPKTAAPEPIFNDLGFWSARGQNREASTQLVSLAPTIAQGKKILQVSNPHSGGDWTTYITRTPFPVANHSILSWDYRVPGGVKVNLYAQIDGNWREIGWTAGLTPGQESAQLGQVADAVSDGKWHRARFDLGAALQSRGISATQIEALAFAAPDADYLRAGLGGNHQGATYWVRGFEAF